MSSMKDRFPGGYFAFGPEPVPQTRKRALIIDDDNSDEEENIDIKIISGTKKKKLKIIYDDDSDNEMEKEKGSTFYGVNRYDLSFTNDEIYNLLTMDGLDIQNVPSESQMFKSTMVYVHAFLYIGCNDDFFRTTKDKWKLTSEQYHEAWEIIIEQLILRYDRIKERMKDSQEAIINELDEDRRELDNNIMGAIEPEELEAKTAKLNEKLNQERMQVENVSINLKHAMDDADALNDHKIIQLALNTDVPILGKTFRKNGLVDSKVRKMLKHLGIFLAGPLDRYEMDLRSIYNSMIRSGPEFRSVARKCALLFDSIGVDVPSLWATFLMEMFNDQGWEKRVNLKDEFDLESYMYKLPDDYLFHNFESIGTSKLMYNVIRNIYDKAMKSDPKLKQPSPDKKMSNKEKSEHGKKVYEWLYNTLSHRVNGLSEYVNGGRAFQSDIHEYVQFYMFATRMNSDNRTLDNVPLFTMDYFGGLDQHCLLLEMLTTYHKKSSDFVSVNKNELVFGSYNSSVPSRMKNGIDYALNTKFFDVKIKRQVYESKEVFKKLLESVNKASYENQFSEMISNDEDEEYENFREKNENYVFARKRMSISYAQDIFNIITEYVDSIRLFNEKSILSNESVKYSVRIRMDNDGYYDRKETDVNFGSVVNTSKFIWKMFSRSLTMIHFHMMIHQIMKVYNMFHRTPLSSSGENDIELDEYRGDKITDSIYDFVNEVPSYLIQYDEKYINKLIMFCQNFVFPEYINDKSSDYLYDHDDYEERYEKLLHAINVGVLQRDDVSSTVYPIESAYILDQTQTLLTDDIPFAKFDISFLEQKWTPLYSLRSLLGDKKLMNPYPYAIEYTQLVGDELMTDPHFLAEMLKSNMCSMLPLPQQLNDSTFEEIKSRKKKGKKDYSHTVNETSTTGNVLTGAIISDRDAGIYTPLGCINLSTPVLYLKKKYLETRNEEGIRDTLISTYENEKMIFNTVELEAQLSSFEKYKEMDDKPLPYIGGTLSVAHHLFKSVEQHTEEIMKYYDSPSLPYSTVTNMISPLQSVLTNGFNKFKIEPPEKEEMESKNFLESAIYDMAYSMDSEKHKRAKEPMENTKRGLTMGDVFINAVGNYWTDNKRIMDAQKMSGTYLKTSNVTVQENVSNGFDKIEFKNPMVFNGKDYDDLKREVIHNFYGIENLEKNDEEEEDFTYAVEDSIRPANCIRYWNLMELQKRSLFNYEPNDPNHVGFIDHIMYDPLSMVFFISSHFMAIAARTNHQLEIYRFMIALACSLDRHNLKLMLNIEEEVKKVKVLKGEGYSKEAIDYANDYYKVFSDYDGSIVEYMFNLMRSTQNGSEVLISNILKSVSAVYDVNKLPKLFGVMNKSNRLHGSLEFSLYFAQFTVPLKLDIKNLKVSYSDVNDDFLDMLVGLNKNPEDFDMKLKEDREMVNVIMKRVDAISSYRWTLSGELYGMMSTRLINFINMHNATEKESNYNRRDVDGTTPTTRMLSHVIFKSPNLVNKVFKTFKDYRETVEEVFNGKSYFKLNHFPLSNERKTMDPENLEYDLSSYLVWNLFDDISDGYSNPFELMVEFIQYFEQVNNRKMDIQRKFNLPLGWFVEHFADADTSKFLELFWKYLIVNDPLSARAFFFIEMGKGRKNRKVLTNDLISELLLLSPTLYQHTIDIDPVIFTDSRWINDKINETPLKNDLFFMVVSMTFKNVMEKNRNGHSEDFNQRSDDIKFLQKMTGYDVFDNESQNSLSIDRIKNFVGDVKQNDDVGSIDWVKLIDNNVPWDNYAQRMKNRLHYLNYFTKFIALDKKLSTEFARKYSIILLKLNSTLQFMELLSKDDRKKIKLDLIDKSKEWKGFGSDYRVEKTDPTNVNLDIDPFEINKKMHSMSINDVMDLLN